MPKQLLKRVKNKSGKVDPKRLIPTGSTLLNLACSNTVFGGYGMGKVVNLVGDRSAGKSILALTGLAEMATKKRFIDYELIYDDVELANEFDIEKYFGRLHERLDHERAPSDTIQDFYGNFKVAQGQNHPYVYVLDSFDALTSKEEHERAKRMQSIAIGKAKKEKGTYGTEKTKLLKRILTETKAGLGGSLLVIVSQVIQNIDRGPFDKKYDKTGGENLKHMIAHEIWLQRVGAITKTINKVNYEIGQYVKLNVTKNKITGKRRKVEIAIFDDYGIDDFLSVMNYLIYVKHWTGGAGYDAEIKAPEFDFKGKKQEFRTVLKKDKKMWLEMRKLCGRVWNEIQDQLEYDGESRF